MATVGNQSFLQNSRALQEEMSEQLANMAAQLKRNAIHFAGSLDKDKAIVQAEFTFWDSAQICAHHNDSVNIRPQYGS